MKKPVVCLLFVLLAGGVLAEDTIYVRDAKGERSGPYVVREGTMITAGGQQMEIERVVSDRDRVEDLFSRTLVPEVDFKKTPAGEVVKQLGDLWTKHRPSGARADVKFVYLPEGMASTEPEVLVEDNTREKQKEPILTLKAKNVTLLQVMKLARSVAGIDYRLDLNTVLFAPLGLPLAPIEQRTYDVSTFGGPRNEESLKAVFQYLGVAWPKGSSYQYLPSLGRLIVANTADNHDLLAPIRDMASARLVEIEISFIAYPKMEIENLAKKGRVGCNELIMLWREGKGNLLASPRVIIKAGQEATVKTVKEYIYPTAFTYTMPSENMTNSTTRSTAENASGREGVAVPENFETRDVGVILQVTPQLAEEGNLIDVTLQPQHVFEPEWVDYAKGTTPTGKERSAVHFEQPFFFLNTISTSISLHDGERALLGGGMETPDKTKFVYAFVTATLLDASGNLIKRQTQSRRQ